MLLILIVVLDWRVPAPDLLRGSVSWSALSSMMLPWGMTNLWQNTSGFMSFSELRVCDYTQLHSSSGSLQPWSNVLLATPISCCYFWPLHPTGPGLTSPRALAGNLDPGISSNWQVRNSWCTVYDQTYCLLVFHTLGHSSEYIFLFGLKSVWTWNFWVFRLC